MGVQRRIADIQPFAELAQGPTTVVYKGYQRALDRFVLLKVLRRNVGHDEALARRFEEEARLVAQIQHPNVVAVYAFGREDGQSYLAAEFVDGVDLRGLLAQGPLPVELATFVLLEAARGLQAAHTHGILHRDLKPSNLLIGHGGHVKLTDFGMASLLDDDAALEVRGTPAYLAPEQVRGAAPAKTSDLFSLGATFFEMLTARPAFTGADAGGLLDAVLHHDPLPRLERFADVPEGAHRICARLLAKDPARRYPGVEALMDDLEAFRAAAGLTTGAAALAAYQEAPDAYRHAAQAAPAPVEARAAVPDGVPAPRRRARYAVGLALAVLLSGSLAGALLLRDAEPDAANGPTPEEAQGLRQPVVDASSPPVPTQAPSEDEPTAGDATRTEVPEAKPAAVTPSPQPAAVTPLRADSSDAAEKQAGETGTLRVNASPWAAVFVDGDSVGATPLSRPLSPGVHRVTLKNPSFPVHVAQVDIAASEETPLNVSLWDLVGTLRMEVSPWADVVVDGRWRDTTPLERPLILTPGRHTLRLRHRDLGAWDTTLTVEAGQELVLRVNLHARLGNH